MKGCELNRIEQGQRGDEWDLSPKVMVDSGKAMNEKGRCDSTEGLLLVWF